MDKTNSLPHDIHDRGYKYLLSFKKIFQQLIEGHVKEEWKDKLDFSKSKRIEKSFIFEAFEAQESDILYKVPLIGANKDVYLYVLIEHQSSVDFSMAFRVMQYIMRFWFDYYKNTEKSLRSRKDFRLPPVFPIVLYNGDNRWTAATSLREIVEHGEIFGDYIPNVNYHLIDIPRTDIEMLKEKRDVLSAIFLLEHDIKREIFPRVWEEAVELVRTETDFEIWKAGAIWCRMFLESQYPEELRPLADKLKFAEATEGNKEEVISMLKQMPQRLVDYGMQKGIQKGIQKGMQEGIQKGIQKGMQEGIQKGIIRGLRKKFGEVPTTLVKQINSIKDMEKLEELLDQTMVVKNLAEFKIQK